VNDLVKVELKNLFRTQNQGGGVFLGNDEKSFAIFIGPAELNALILAGGGIAVQRPLTHNLLDMILSGFDIEVRSVVINDLVEDAFHAILTLAQGEHEVVIDCRPSDALILAVMRKLPVFVTRDLFEKVESGDELLSAMRDELKKVEGGEPSSPGPDADKPRKRPAARRGRKPGRDEAASDDAARAESGEGALPASAREAPTPPPARGAKGRKGESGPEGGLGDVREIPGIDWGSLFGK
jgi:hypothetical protein